jgi:hypothetical protein
MNRLKRLTKTASFTLENINYYDELTEDQQKLIKKLDDDYVFNRAQISTIVYCLLDNFTDEQIKFIANPNFDAQLMRFIEIGFEKNLSKEAVALYSNPQFDYNQMRTILGALTDNGLSVEQVKVFATTKFDNFQMSVIRDGFINGYTMEQVKMYAKPAFDYDQMLYIYSGIRHLGEEKTKLFANPGISAETMNQIFDDFEKNKLSIEDVKEKYKLASRKSKINRLGNR